MPKLFMRAPPPAALQRRGHSWSRKQTTIDGSFEASPLDVTAWDLQHVKILHNKFRDDGQDFGMDRASVRDIMTSALPLARALTGDLWDAYVKDDEEMLYPLELFAALAMQCHGLSREKTGFLFDMFDFRGRQEASYDEVVICISTVVGALSKVSSRCRLLNEAQVGKLADDAYVTADRDAGCPLPRSDFLEWVEKRLSINLSGDVTLEDVAKALGVWSDEHQQGQEKKAHKDQQIGPASARSDTGYHKEAEDGTAA